MKQAVTTDIVAGVVNDIAGAPPIDVVELLPRGTLRSFRIVGSVPLTIRVDEDPASRRVDVEALAFVALQTATSPPVVPGLRTRHVLFGKDGIERRFLAYDWIEGSTLSAPLPMARVREVGQLMGTLHAARVMDLMGRVPSSSMSLLDGYRKTADALRGWISLREQDGLGHDPLTLTLSDLLRSMRSYVVAQDNTFRTAQRRVLCHGALAPDFIVARAERGPMSSPLQLVGLDQATMGDAAFDLARLVVASELDQSPNAVSAEEAEDELLRSYAETLAEAEREDPRFVQRYFAARTLELMARPVSRLARLARIKRGDEEVLDDPVVALERESAAAVTEIARAMNALRDLAGRARAVTVAEVRAMGRLVVVEDMVLKGRTFRLALTGEPYTGKTEVGALLAKRLDHHFLGTGVLSRALAWVERHPRANDDVSTPRALIRTLFDRGFRVQPQVEPPFYAAFLDDEDITETLREGERAQVIRAGALLDDDTIRSALRDELERRFVGEGLVIEGVYAEALLGSRVQSFHLVGDAGVRRARLVAHRQDLENDAAAEALLRRLDAEAPKAAPDAHRIDVASRPAAAAALAVLEHLLPANRRRPPDLSNRVPL